MLMQVSFHCSPEELNEIEFTMEFQEQNAKVPCIFDHFLHKGLLLFEVKLVFHDLLTTAGNSCRVTLGLAFSPEPLSWYSSLHEDVLKAFGLIRVSWMIRCKNHGLCDLLTILFIPPISKMGLAATRVHVHMVGDQSILTICCMALGVVNHDQCLIPWSMSLLKCRDDFFLQLKHHKSTLYLNNGRNVDYLLDKQLSSPIPIIIFTIFKSLTCIPQPTNC